MVHGTSHFSLPSLSAEICLLGYHRGNKLRWLWLTMWWAEPAAPLFRRHGETAGGLRGCVSGLMWASGPGLVPEHGAGQ